MPLDPNIPPVSTRPREESRSWFGYLANENVEHVAQRITNLLTGQCYTFVAYNTTLTRSMPEVRTGQRVKTLEGNGKRPPISVSKIGGKQSWDPTPSRSCGVSVSDSYGVWGIHSEHATEADAYADADSERFARCTYVSIDGGLTTDPRDRGRNDRIEITQYNYMSPRERLHWVIAVEPPNRELLDERDELLAAIRQVEDSWESGDLAGAVNEAVSLLPEDES